jgi:HCOMODA/2-hydroxy-3-carboxy-muconic semialdehyde decarboxylase
VLPFTITKEPLRPIVHTASVIGAEIPVWDIRTKFGAPTCSCARSSRVATWRLRSAGNTCALLRGHGAVVVGASIERAVLTAIYLQVNAKVLLQALQLGPPERCRRRDCALERDAILAARTRSQLGILLPARGVDPG